MKKLQKMLTYKEKYIIIMHVVEMLKKKPDVQKKKYEAPWSSG